MYINNIIYKSKVEFISLIICKVGFTPVILYTF